jgi:hypothetical protein
VLPPSVPNAKVAWLEVDELDVFESLEQFFAFMVEYNKQIATLWPARK